MLVPSGRLSSNPSMLELITAAKKCRENALIITKSMCDVSINIVYKSIQKNQNILYVLHVITHYIYLFLKSIQMENV